MSPIKQYRNKTDKTQSDLAGDLGVDTQFVSNLERKLAPIPAKHFKRLNRSIGVPVKELMEYNVDRYIARMKLEMKRN